MAVSYTHLDVYKRQGCGVLHLVGQFLYNLLLFFQYSFAWHFFHLPAVSQAQYNKTSFSELPEKDAVNDMMDRFRSFLGRPVARYAYAPAVLRMKPCKFNIG